MKTTELAVITFALFGLSSGSAMAADPALDPQIRGLESAVAARAAKDAACEQDSSDPFEPAYRVNHPASPMHGHCVDTRTERHVYVVPGGQDPRFVAEPGILWAANVWHGEHYYIAR